MREKYYNAVQVSEEFIIADFDVETPACKDDPYVRIGKFDHYPLTEEEYTEFVANYPVVGKKSEVFPNGVCGEDDFIDALDYALKKI